CARGPRGPAPCARRTGFVRASQRAESRSSPTRGAAEGRPLVSRRQGPATTKRGSRPPGRGYFTTTALDVRLLSRRSRVQLPPHNQSFSSLFREQTRRGPRDPEFFCASRFVGVAPKNDAKRNCTRGSHGTDVQRDDRQRPVSACCTSQRPIGSVEDAAMGSALLLGGIYAAGRVAVESRVLGRGAKGLVDSARDPRCD